MIKRTKIINKKSYILYGIYGSKQQAKLVINELLSRQPIKSYRIIKEDNKYSLYIMGHYGKKSNTRFLELK